MSGPSALTVRAARPSDCEAILAAHTNAIRVLCQADYSETQLAAWADRLAPTGYLPAMQRNVFLVAEVNGQVVGFGELALVEGEIVAIYIHPEHARQGIGTRLFRELDRIARASGLRSLHLDSSLGAVRFYERLGFVSGPANVHRLGNGMEIPCIPMTRHND